MTEIQETTVPGLVKVDSRDEGNQTNFTTLKLDFEPEELMFNNMNPYRGRQQMNMMSGQVVMNPY